MTRRLTRVVLTLALALPGGCAPPTQVIDLRDVSPAERVVIADMPIVPLGVAPPQGLGSVAPVTGFGCGNSRKAAHDRAVQQLRIKALQLRATTVIDVLVQPSDSHVCLFDYGALAHGVAAAPWATTPPTY